jgi:hypothetical protein
MSASKHNSRFENTAWFLMGAFFSIFAFFFVALIPENRDSVLKRKAQEESQNSELKFKHHNTEGKTIYCTQCGTEGSSQQSFCTNCGAQLLGSTKSKESEISNAAAIWWSVGILGGGMLIALFVIFYS